MKWQVDEMTWHDKFIEFWGKREADSNKKLFPRNSIDFTSIGNVQSQPHPIKLLQQQYWSIVS